MAPHRDRLPRRRRARARLVPAGDLSLQFTGAPPGKTVHLRLRRAGTEFGVHAEFPLHGRRDLLVPGLPAGSFVVRAEIGDSWEPRVLAEASVVIAPGQRSSATLELPVVKQPITVRLGGTLQVPAAWKVAKPRVVFMLLDENLTGQKGWLHADLAQKDGASDVWRFRLPEKVQTGRYQGVVKPCGYRAAVLVAGGASEEIEIHVPPPVPVTVHVIDVATGETAPVRTISWNMQLPKGVSGYSPAQSKRNAETRRFELTAPQGTLYLDPGGDDYVATSHEGTRIGPDPSEVTLRVARVCEILVVLRAGGRPVPNANRVEVEAEPLQGEGSILVWGRRPTGPVCGSTNLASIDSVWRRPRATSPSSRSRSRRAAGR